MHTLIPQIHLVVSLVQTRLGFGVLTLYHRSKVSPSLKYYWNGFQKLPRRNHIPEMSLVSRGFNIFLSLLKKTIGSIKLQWATTSGRLKVFLWIQDGLQACFLRQHNTDIITISSLFSNASVTPLSFYTYSPSCIFSQTTVRLLQCYTWCLCQVAPHQPGWKIMPSFQPALLSLLLPHLSLSS